MYHNMYIRTYSNTGRQFISRERYLRRAARASVWCFPTATVTAELCLARAFIHIKRSLPCPLPNLHHHHILALSSELCAMLQLPLGLHTSALSRPPHRSAVSFPMSSFAHQCQALGSTTSFCLHHRCLPWFIGCRLLVIEVACIYLIYGAWS